jgi:hypothetical protein
MDPYDFFRIKIIWLGSLECGDATHIKTKPKGPLHQSGKPVLTLTLIASFRRHHQRQWQGNLIDCDYPYCTAFLVTAVSHSFICSFLGWIDSEVVLTADPKTLLFPNPNLSTTTEGDTTVKETSCRLGINTTSPCCFTAAHLHATTPSLLHRVV